MKETRKHKQPTDASNVRKHRESTERHHCETLLEALQDVLEASRDSKLEKSLFRFEDWGRNAFDYLNERMGLTDEQCILLAIIFEEGVDGHAMMRDLCEHLKCTKLEILKHQNDIDTLIERGLIEPSGHFCYEVPSEALSAIQKNMKYNYETASCKTADDLFDELFRLHLSCYHDEFNSITLSERVANCIEHNIKIKAAKTLLNYKRNLKDNEFRLLVFASVDWMMGNKNFNIQDCGFIFDNYAMGRTLNASMIKGTSTLIKDGLIECVESNGMASRNEYQLTDKAKMSINPEFSNSVRGVISGCNMIKYSDIRKKEMYYNDTESTQISDLSQLLQERNLKSIMKRMDKRGMRSGFSCIFYGGPGTGKTETVYQLARETKRNIFQVDASQLRSKWVGESEKNAKNIFESYRQLCKNSKMKPILFLNEADAIICRRMEGAERSVDKSENTIQNIILQEIENLDGILIATTNLVKNMDKAFERRFLYKVYFSQPEASVKAKIWKAIIPELKIAECNKLAEMFPNFAGGQIENVSRKSMVSEILHGQNANIEDIVEICNAEMFENKTARQIGFKAY
ncbi:MAG: ATP-binding protein [Bacteroidales bacterium]|nr:ATP-binding protein [Bacteroidales bacterium]